MDEWLLMQSTVVIAPAPTSFDMVVIRLDDNASVATIVSAPFAISHAAALTVMCKRPRSWLRIRSAARCAESVVCSASPATRCVPGSKKATDLPELATTLVAGQADDVLELDELWSFVRRRTNKRWVWLALCRRTRQIVAYAIGDRSEATCRLLWQRIPASYRHGLLYTDFWDSYQKVLPDKQHRPVGKESGHTNHIERWNNTLRQRLARFVRKTLSFSKSEQMHEFCLRLFLYHYNRDRANNLK